MLRGIGSLQRLHWLVVAISLLVTASAWGASRALVAERGAVRFERAADHLIEMVVERMSRYEDALQAGVATIAARGGEIDRDTWQEFARTLRIEKRYPGIEGIGVIRRVPANGLDELVARERLSDPAFAVHPAREPVERGGAADGPSEGVAGDARAEHDLAFGDVEHFYPIVHIEPRASNREAIGPRSRAHERNRLEGIQRAERLAPCANHRPDRARAGSGASGRGFLFIAPVPGFDGFVYAPFVVDKLVDRALGRERREVLVAIDDAAGSSSTTNTRSPPRITTPSRCSRAPSRWRSTDASGASTSAATSPFARAWRCTSRCWCSPPASSSTRC